MLKVVLLVSSYRVNILGFINIFIRIFINMLNILSTFCLYVSLCSYQNRMTSFTLVRILGFVSPEIMQKSSGHSFQLPNVLSSPL